MLRIPTHRSPTHPGEMLREEFLVPLGISTQDVAERIRVPSHVLERLIREGGEITPDLALRFSRLFGTTPDFWLNGQMVWNLFHTLRAPEAADLAEITPLPLTPAGNAEPE